VFSTNYYSDEDTSKTSYIYFGGWETSIVSNEDDIVWFNLTEEDKNLKGFWVIEGGNVFYGDSKRSAGTLGSTIIDTGASISYIPENVLDNLISDMKKSCKKQSGLYVCKCSSAADFKDIYFGFEDDYVV